MFRLNRHFVSAFLPILPLAFCHGCGGGGSSDTAPQTSSPPVEVTSPATVNHAPSISGQVVDSVRVGETYDWKPTATDQDGDALSFTAVNLPPWASMESSSGHITGTPGEGDVGIYESITITVADAKQQSAATAPFSITVVGDVGTGVASLQWETPPSKLDGSPLDDLAGYRILYGRSSDDLDKSVLVGNPSTTSYEFNSLSSGIWYFAVVAVSSCGLEGPPTTVASKSI
jgi:Putative Ig domain